MFQRTVLRQRRAVQSALSFRAISSQRLSARQTSPLQQLSQSMRQSPFRPVPRCYSTENGANKEEPKKEEEKKEEEKKEEEKNAENEGAAAGEAEAPAESAEELLKKELEAKNKEIVDLKDKYLRSVAEFRNFQDRTKRDIEAARTFAIQRFATDLLETIDNFERALSSVPAEKLSAAEAEGNKELNDLYQGLKMTESVLMSTLKKHGLERFDPSEPTEDGKPQKFDPNRHEATFMAKAEGREDGDIMHVQSKGFSLHGRVLRAAKVGVVKNA